MTQVPISRTILIQSDGDAQESDIFEFAIEAMSRVDKFVEEYHNIERVSDTSVVRLCDTHLKEEFVKAQCTVATKTV